MNSSCNICDTKPDHIRHFRRTIWEQRPSHWLRVWTKRARDRHHLRKQRRIDRDAFKQLLKLDDAQLKDIGVTQQDVKWASELPLSQNAALELEHRALRRQGN